MAIYVDTLRPCIKSREWGWAKSCHLFADTITELHDFAAEIGLRRSWFQDHTRLPHYDLNESRRREAVHKGAIEATDEQVVAHMRPLKPTKEAR